MKFKLDECLDIRLAALFAEPGHDVKTVYEEKLSGVSDEAVYNACVQEKRILITQDMDFSNPYRFSPRSTEGIIVLRNPSQLLSESEHLIQLVILKVGEENPHGRLWVVAHNGIRIWPSE